MKKTILITGSTDGIGKEMAIRTAEEGHEVILHGRSPERLNQTLLEIENKTGKKFKGYIADLNDFLSVSLMCEEIQKDTEIDVLIHNAGTYEKSLHLNNDGVEKTLAVNYVSNVLINEKLFDFFTKKERTNGLRIILVSSIAHQSGKYNLDNWFKPTSYNAYLAYANSKMAQIMYCYYIAPYLEKYRITINAMHPGVIDTKILRDNFGMKGAPISEGIKTMYYLALSDEVENTTGKYFSDQKIHRSSPDTYNVEYQKELYLKTKEAIKNYL